MKTILYKKYKSHWIYSDGYRWSISESRLPFNKIKFIYYPTTKVLKNKTIIFKISSRCNLSCKYCYSNKIDEKISYKTVSLFCDFVNSFNEPISIIFHGGEPLLEFNNIKYIINNINSKKVIFNIQTNGVLLDSDKVAFFKKNNVNLCVSIDGPKEFHNYYRSQHKLTIKKILLFNKIINFNSICVLNKKSILAPKKLVDFYVGCGITNFKFNIIDDFNEEYSVNQIISFYKQLYDIIVSHNTIEKNKVYELKLSEIAKRLLFGVRSSKCNNLHCDAGKNLFSIDIYGNIFPCDYFCEYHKNKIGFLNTKKFNLAVFKKLLKKNISVQCQKCVFKNIVDCNCLERNIFYNNKKYCLIWQDIIYFLMVKITENPSEVALLIKND